MTDIIDAVQLQEIGDALVDLYDLTIGDITIYLYNGLEDGTESIWFNDRESPYTAREYQAFPVELTGLEYASDGAAARPNLAMANVVSLAVIIAYGDSELGQDLDTLGITKNEDLLGSRITRRRTLAKHLSSSTGGGVAPVEFPPQTFVLDRISTENNIIVEFELASPFDVEGVVLPSRAVIGKYCPWRYQGATASEPVGGCTWPQNSNNVFWDESDSQITSFTTYSSTSNYTAGDKVRYDNKIWQAIRPSKNKQPDKFPPFWKRIDLCSKTITGCKTRFQYNSNSSTPLPFGGFPGTRKFR